MNASRAIPTILDHKNHKVAAEYLACLFAFAIGKAFAYLRWEG